MEPRFRECYRRYTWGALFLMVLVVSLAIYNLTFLFLQVDDIITPH